MQLIIFLSRSSSLSQRLLLLALGYCAAAAIFFPQTFFLVLDQLRLPRLLPMVAVVTVLALIVVTVVHRPVSPIRFIRELVTERAAGVAVIIAAFVVSGSAFTTLKHQYTSLLPFFADPAIAAIDSALHFGDPALWLRAILPAALDYPLFCLYSLAWFIEVLAGVAIAAWLPDRTLRERYFATFTIGVMVLSSAVRALFNAAGPIFYDRIHGGDRFAWLIGELSSTTGGMKAMDFSNYLHSSYASGATVLGSGISAMPSLHVALAFLNALFFARLSRVTAVIGWSYFAIILFGSVYFGWHYAIDGYVSMLVIWVFWQRFAGPAGVPRHAA